MSKKRISIAAGKFKAECLQLMDLVAKNGSELIITKRGKPVAKLVPIDEQPVDLFGYLRGELNIIGDVIEPVSERWDAVPTCPVIRGFASFMSYSFIPQNNDRFEMLDCQ